MALAGCNEIAGQPEPIKRPVLTATVHYEQEVPSRSFVGVIRPRIETEMAFRIGGKVSARLVDAGALVDAGQPLATLDEADLRLQTEQAEAELRAAIGVVAQAVAAQSRVKALRTNGWSTEAQFDQAKATVAEAQARLVRAERSVELTRNSLSYATLVADASGIVTASLIQPGQVITAGQAAVRIAQLAEKEIVVAIPESLVTRAKSAGAQVSIWSAPDKRYVAKLRELAPSADPVTRTFLAKYAIPDAGNEVQLGMTATLSLTDAESSRVARLPLSALVNQGDGTALYVVDENTGTLSLKPVVVKAYDGRDVLISGGMDEGALVVTVGVHKLDPAQRVRVVSSLPF
jgi:RND family efflux transporter MFP subunit